mgnify:CR=1 FL=1
MEKCVSVVKDALRKAIEKYGPAILRAGWTWQRRVLMVDFKMRDCLSRDIIERAVSSLAIEMQQGDDVIFFWVSLPLATGVVSPGGSNYPLYTLAEAMYIGFYQEDPVSAHERMYHVLEPILLSDNPDARSVAKALFIPAYPKYWIALMERYVKFLEMLDEDRRRAVCRTLEKSIIVMFYGFELTYDGKSYRARVPLKRRFLDLCLELRGVFSP